MPKVSVIIPTYNMVNYLEEAIESALGQTYKDFEIVVLDDGSTDNTREIVEKYIIRFPNYIRYICQENKGLAVARNTALKNAEGEFIALLDADDKWLPNRLEEEIKVIESDPEIGLVHADAMLMDENGGFIRKRERDKKLLSGYLFKNLFVRKVYISCPTVLVRKECLDRVGLFDENLSRLGCEDRDEWLRIAREYRIEYIDNVLAYYRYNRNGMSKNREKMVRARYYVVNKFYSKGYVSRKMRRIALAQIHREIGDEFLYEGRWQESKQEYYRSLNYWPFSFWPWVNVMKAILGKNPK